MPKKQIEIACRRRQVQANVPATSNACFKAAGIFALFGLVLAVAENGKRR